MTLGEKIAALRRERKLSQGDLAEKLDVSRQSVSKWETGQAAPELDKIIKLADLFGVSVDELVREEERPKPETVKTKVTEKIIYVEKPKAGLTAVQVLGVVCAVSGAVLAILGAAGTAVLLLPGLALVILSLPLLLAKKHPWLVMGWVLLGGSCVILNPYTSISAWGMVGGFRALCAYLSYADYGTPGFRTYILGASIGIVRGILALALAVFTGRLWWKKRKGHNCPTEEPKDE